MTNKMYKIRGLLILFTFLLNITIRELYNNLEMRISDRQTDRQTNKQKEDNYCSSMI